MSLAPLADLSDLNDIPGVTIDETNTALANRLLDSVSTAVREAAGATISTATATITLTGTREKWLRLPGWAVREVTAVAIEGETVTDYKLLDGRLWRRWGWRPRHLDLGHDWDEPSLVTVTYTQGVPTVPADIVSLVVSLVAFGLTQGSGQFQRGLSSESIDDYQVSYTRGDDEIIDASGLPDATRDALAARFGNTVFVTGSES